MKRFLINQASSPYNKGEVAIAVSLIESIRKFYPDAEISITSPAPDEAERRYSKYRVKIYPRLLNPAASNEGLRSISNFFKMVLAAFSCLVRTKIDIFHISDSDKATFDIFRKADVVIIGGGGTFGGAKYRSISGNLFPIYLARKLGKKVMVYAPSVEPFKSKIVKAATKIAFNYADVITVREQLTFNQLKSLGIKTPVHLTADPSFLLGNEPLDLGLALLNEVGVSRNENSLLIGMTIRKWGFSRETDSATKRKRYADSIQQTIEKILATRNDARIVIFTTCINVQFNDDDRLTANLVRNSIKENLRERVHVLTRDYSPQEIKAMIGNMDVFISTRFHSTVFALTMNIPVMLIATELHKNRGLMQMMGLADYTLDASSVTSDTVFKAADKLISERQLVAQRISEKLPTIKAQSAKNEEYLQDLVNQK